MAAPVAGTGGGPGSESQRRGVSRAFHAQGQPAARPGGDDPLSGQSLSRKTYERLEPYRRRSGLVDDFEAPIGLYLQAAAPALSIRRMLRNLKEIHRTQQDWARFIPVQDRRSAPAAGLGR